MPKQHVRTFYCIDLDRTIFDTALFGDMTVGLVREHNPMLADELKAAINDNLFFGATFLIRDFLIERIGVEQTEAIEEKRRVKAQDGSLKIPGTDALLNAIARTESASGGILTFGVYDRQMVKIRLGGLEGYPLLVTDNKHKGSLISSWWNGSVFVLPEQYGGVTADEVILVDDHAGSFEGLPANARGYLVEARAIAPVGEGTVTADFTRTPTLETLLNREIEQGRIDKV